MSDEELKAELERLRKENAALKREPIPHTAIHTMQRARQPKSSKT